MDGIKILEELARWLFSIWILCVIAAVTLLIYAIITDYPREFCIGLFVLGVTACVRYDLCKEE